MTIELEQKCGKKIGETQIEIKIIFSFLDYSALKNKL
jgi:hypothetical protein